MFAGVIFTPFREVLFLCNREIFMKFRFKFVTFAVMLLGATSVFASTHVPYDDKSVYNRSAVGTSSSMPHLFSDRLLARNEHHHGHDAPPPKHSHGHDAPPPKPSHGHDAPPPKPSHGHDAPPPKPSHGHDAPPPKPSHGHDAPPPKPSHGHDAPPPKHSHGPMVIPPGPGVGPGPHPHH